MTKEDALMVADLSENALWRWLRSNPAHMCGSPAHAREVALSTLAEVIRERDRGPACAVCLSSGAPAVGK